MVSEAAPSHLILYSNADDQQINHPQLYLTAQSGRLPRNLEDFS